MQMTYLQALGCAIGEALDENPRVVVMGSRFGGHFAVQEDEALGRALAKHAARVYMSVPIAEFGLAGAAVGVALVGGRPLLSFNIASFMLHGFPPIVNEAPNVRYTTGGRVNSPLTCYALGGIRGGGSSQHSHRLQSMFGNIPGLQILTPATAGDAYGLMKWCLLESQDPTVFLAHSELLLSGEDVDLSAAPLPVGVARICRPGRDVSVIAHSVTVPRSIKAAEVLQRDHGISAEVIDLRTLAPFDRGTLLASVRKTGYAVIADECHKSFGVNAEVAAVLAEEAFPALKAPVRRVATADVPIPYDKGLEREISVTAEKIVEGVLATLGRPVGVGV